ncbi:hypothetical protein ACFYVL_06145 [Streptomyces sp. NPDC004111]|uniref:hypothetical protein n=1 Tax=Streptomyces sp. NPDC004111 TaxID=3364690 RepID=UPI0036A2961E
MADGARKRRTVLGGLLAGAVLATGLGACAVNGGPFRESYCWGAWQEDSGPSFLGDEALGESGSRRRESSQSPAPSAGRPGATCTVGVTSTGMGRPTTYDAKVVVDYGPLPEAVEERRAWLAANLHGSKSPLPDGLDGVVSVSGAFLVLPKACDVKGRPSVVTLSSVRADGTPGKWTAGTRIGTYEHVTRMLLDVANTGMGSAGCAPERPLRTASPHVVVAHEDDLRDLPFCRIPGVGFGSEGSWIGVYSQQWIGAVTPRLQSCSVMWKIPGARDESTAQYVMAGSPRTAALFEGLPEGIPEGLTHVTCQGRRTVFYGHAQGSLVPGKAAVERSFTNFVRSVGNRIGCGNGVRA